MAYPDYSLASTSRFNTGFSLPTGAQSQMTHVVPAYAQGANSSTPIPIAQVIANPYANVSPDAFIAGSQGRVDAARTAAMSYDPSQEAKDARVWEQPVSGSSMDRQMLDAVGQRIAGGYAPSAAEDAQQQAIQAVTARQQQQATQNAWLKQQGIPEYARIGTPDTAELPQRARPGSTIEGDYSGFAAPGTRIFGTADRTGRVNSFTGAGLPGYGGGGAGGASDIANTISKMSSRLAAIGRSGDTKDLLERRELIRNMDALSRVHATLSQHELGMAQVGEQTRASKQRERATSAAQASLIPSNLKSMSEVIASQNPDVLRSLIAAWQGGYAQPKVQAYNPLGMFAPGMGGMPTYYGAPEMGANIGATNIYPQ